MSQGPAVRLPELRPDLQLLPGATGASGEPTWLIHDAALNRFVQIDIATYETLRHWQPGAAAEQMIAAVNAAGAVHIDAQSLGQLITFLQASNLTTDAPPDGWCRWARATETRHHSILASMVHGYLFFRIPLCRPQAFLERTLPAARVLGSLPVLLAISAMGAAGIYLASREWDAFTATFLSFFTWEGAAVMALTLGLVKGAHELGHAYTAVAYGCRVHTMGVAFVVMAPLLYTDVTDAWRLKDRRKRIAIDSAGIKVELAIAGVALFFWAFLPEGPLRGLAFTLSAVSVVSSLAINLNPFMRFDGYYLLSELVGVENLQPRAFELGRWKMRNLLFGLDRPPPEQLPAGLTTGLIAYAWITWIYRLVLFVGIAVLVYQYFFKVLGIALFAVEIIYFVGRPIVNEMKLWLRNRAEIATRRRSWITAGVAAAALAGCLLPLSTRVEIPAVVESAQLQPLHASRAAMIAEIYVSLGATVTAGQRLVRLSSPEVDQDIALTRTRLAMGRLQHGRRGADRTDRESSLVLESSIDSLEAKLEGLEKERDDLLLIAPFDGSIIELDPALQPGRWISPRDTIALVAGNATVVAKGYVSEADIGRIAAGGLGTFIPEMPARASLPVRIEQVAATSASQIEIADLSSAYAGRIAVTVDDRRRLVPTAAQYLVHMSVATSPGLNDLSVRGVVLARGNSESLMARVWRQTVKVLVRESGA